MGSANCVPVALAAGRADGRSGHSWRATVFVTLLLAASCAIVPARAASAACVGNCGTSGADGVVTAPPIPGVTTYQFVSTSGGAAGGGQLPGVGGTNGSSFSTSAFTVNAGSTLEFSFNFVTSDGAGFPDYAWAQLQTPGGDVIATLVTAATQPSGSIIPAQGAAFPPISGTLDPASVPIIAGAPNWAPLGASSGTCFAAGCGYTGWVNESYVIPTTGTYVLVFGVSNVKDTNFDSGLAFAGSTINALGNIDNAMPFYLASDLGVSLNPAFNGGTLRMDQPDATYAENFTLDGSSTNTIDEFGNSSTFSGVFSDAFAGTPGNIVIADSVGGGAVTFLGANTYTGTTTIDAGAALIIGAGGSITNANTLTNAGSLQVDSGGAVTVATIGNEATSAITNFGAINAALNNAGSVDNAAGAVWTGDVLSNTGTIVNSGTWNAVNFTNDAGGAVTTTGILTATGTLNNNGDFNAQGTLTTPVINNSGTFTVTGPLMGNIASFNNTGQLSVVAGGSFTAGAVNNGATGVITNFGAITDDLDNFGTVINNGTYTADVNNFSTGVIINNGLWIGDLLTNTGTVSNSGTWNAANFNNDAGGSVTTTGTLTATTGLNNAGVFNAEGVLTTPSVTNTGAFTVTGPLTGIDSFTNAGSLQVNAAASITLASSLDNSGSVVNDGSFTGDVNNAAGGGITNAGLWTGDLLTNTGAVSNTGTWNAANFNNDAGGSVTTTGTLTATTGLTNAGAFNAEGILTTPSVTNTGAFTVTGPLTGIDSFTNAGSLQVNAAASITLGSTLVNSGIVVNDGSFAGDVRNAAGGGIMNVGLWTGDLLGNKGDVINSGTWNATNFTNNADGAVTTTGTLTATDGITNAGVFNAEGNVTTPSVNNTGAFIVTGPLMGIDSFTNAGLLQVNAAGSITLGSPLANSGAVVNNGAVTASVVNTANGGIMNAGSWTGDLVSNTGAVINSGTWNAVNFTNNAGGFVETTGTLTVTAGLSNAGRLDAEGILTTPLVSNTGTFNVTGPLTGIASFNNAGLLRVTTGASITVGAPIGNTGFILNNGAVIADVNDFGSGRISNNGNWTGDLLSNAGTVSNSGTWAAGDFNNGLGGTISTSGTLTVTGAINNDGVFNAAGDVTAPLINNGGTFNATRGPLTGVIGTFNNAGILSLIDGMPDDTFTATTFNGQGGRLAIDVDPAANPSIQRGDLLKTTNLSGSTALFINLIGLAGLVNTPIPVIEADNVAPGATVTIANPPGLINYTLEKSGGTYSLISTLNTSAISATPSGINAVVTTLDTGFFQNASAFVSEPANPEKNQWNGGPWVRFANGQNVVDAVTSAQNPTGTAYAPSKVRASFTGYQVGVDLGVANVGGSGWNTHLGVTAGQVFLRTSDLIVTDISSQSTVPFVGLYGAVTGHNFFADFEIRNDFYDLNVANPTAFLSGESLTGEEFAANASAGYRLDLPSSWFIEPSVAFIYSNLKLSALRLNLDQTGISFGVLEFDPLRSALGRAGTRVGATYLLDSIGLAVQPFVTGSVWHEFEGETMSTFSLPATSVPVGVTRVGTFGQVGVGVSGQLVKTGLVGYLRGDYRTGENINGYAVVAGLRYEF